VSVDSKSMLYCEWGSVWSARACVVSAGVDSKSVLYCGCRQRVVSGDKRHAALIRGGS